MLLNADRQTDTASSQSLQHRKEVPKEILTKEKKRNLL